eukprot:gnl/Dysnectes_brevis/2177_a2536_1650.p1 GENE.gnl/Dysnectes_brevis/2177_a2536_1650~~gnl/Dysnectes_brevis/2177_a2536_1650.p1  ORF type:complete len:668 (+),score=267.37 gnl/Dysnectes_brevis/2177_a2536_1650:165-2006(+)
MVEFRIAPVETEFFVCGDDVSTINITLGETSHIVDLDPCDAAFSTYVLFDTMPDVDHPSLLVQGSGCFQVTIVRLSALGKYRVLLSAVLLVVTYAMIATEIIDRTLIALIGLIAAVLALLAVELQLPSIDLLASWVDSDTILLLGGMMILVGIFGDTGVFEVVGVTCLRLSNGQVKRLTFYIALVSAVLSAFLDNVTATLLLAPVVISVCDILDINHVPLLLCQVFFSTIGGTATLVGDPPNVIIGSMLHEYIGFVDFIINLAPAVVVCFVVVWYWISKVVFRTDLTHPKDLHGKEFELELTPEIISNLQETYTVDDPQVAKQCLVIVIIAITSFCAHEFTHISPTWTALICACVVLIVTSKNGERFFTAIHKLELPTLLFFIFLFAMIECLAELGLIRAIASVTSSMVAGIPEDLRLAAACVILVWLSGVASAFIDNIPYTAAMVPVIQTIANDPDLGLPLKPLAWSLALGACLGGNGTLVGASVNIVASGLSDKHWVHYEARMRNTKSTQTEGAVVSTAVGHEGEDVPSSLQISPSSLAMSPVDEDGGVVHPAPLSRAHKKTKVPAEGKYAPKHINFISFFKVGFPVLAWTCLVSSIYVAVIYGVLGWGLE